MANELAFCSFDQLEEFIKSCQNHNEEEEEYHDQEEVLLFGESYWDYLPDIIQEYILELSEVAINQERMDRIEHKIKMKKVLRCSMKFHLCSCFRYVEAGIFVSMYLRIMSCGPSVIICSKII